jgi:hypothetical protein
MTSVIFGSSQAATTDPVFQLQSIVAGFDIVRRQACLTL